jgi:adenine-specific DNA-methyltransferase
MMELAKRKQLGAFYTPPEIARYVSNWAIRNPMDRVLEPSCGEAEFLIAASRRLATLERSLFTFKSSLTGIEVNPAAANRAIQRLTTANVAADIRIGNFFDYSVDERFDAVVGNPPYIRYQQFAGTMRAKALRSALAEGVALNGLSSSWAAFVVQCSRLLTSDGRLGLVLPAELLTVNYAGPVRDYLLRRFARIQMITFEQRVFSNAQEEVILLLAEGAGPTKHFEVYPATSVACLSSLRASRWREYEPQCDTKWSSALLANAQNGNYQESLKRSNFCTLVDWGTTYLGAVTGNNDYFALRASEVDNNGLRENELRRISPPGSKHLRCNTFTTKAWEALARADTKCYLFFPQGKPSKAAQEYIDKGARSGVPSAYKCSVREPWWKVPLVDVADLFLTYMDSERPRLVQNTACVDHLNSLYGIRLHNRSRSLKKLLPIASLNSLTTLGAEMIGRSYGGGILKLEPREADRLPIPSPALVKSKSKQLLSIEPPAASMAAQGRLMEACSIVDKILFPRGSQLKNADLEEIRATRRVLRERRQSRSTRNVEY